MALNFPASPTLGEAFTAEGRTFVWNGLVWLMQDLLFPWATPAEAAAGVAPDKVLSPLVSRGVASALPVPVEPFQGIPTVMGAARVVNVDYQNTFNRDMMVIVALTGSGGAALFAGEGSSGDVALAFVSILQSQPCFGADSSGSCDVFLQDAASQWQHHAVGGVSIGHEDEA